jgi:hypothetical protein
MLSRFAGDGNPARDDRTAAAVSRTGVRMVTITNHEGPRQPGSLAGIREAAAVAVRSPRRGRRLR